MSKKPADWTDEEWQEHLAWRNSLPRFDSTKPGARHVIMIGEPKAGVEDEEQDGNPDDLGIGSK